MNDRLSANTFTRDVRATEGNSGMDVDNLRAPQAGSTDWEQARRQSRRIPLNSLQVGRQNFLDRDLTRPSQIDQKSEVLQEHCSGGGLQVFAEQKPSDLQFSLGVVECRSDVGHGDVMVRAKRAQHVGLNEVGE